MGWFNNIRMAPKLIGSFVLVAALAGLVGGVGLFGLSAMQNRLDWISTNSVPSMAYILQAEFDVAQSVRYTRGEMISTTAAGGAHYLAKAAAARTDAWAQFQRYQALSYNNPHEAELATSARTLFQRWMPINAQIAQIAAQTSRQAKAQAVRISTGPEKQVVEPLATVLAELATINQQAVSSKESDASAAHSAAVVELLAAAAIAMLLAVGLGLLIARSVIRPMVQVQRMLGSMTERCATYLEDALAALARNDLTVAVTPATQPIPSYARDEIGQTAAIANTMLAKI